MLSLIWFYSYFFLLKKKPLLDKYKNYFTVLLILANILITNSIILSGSRAAILFLFIFFLFFSIFSYFYKINFYRNIFIIIINLIFALFKIYIYTPIHNRLIYELFFRISSYQNSLFLFLKKFIPKDYNLDGSLDDRLDLYNNAFNAHNTTKEFLLGTKDFASVSNPINFHNIYLTYFVELGFISVLIIVIIIISIIRKILFVFFKKNYHNIFLVTSMGLCLVAITSLADIRILKYWWFFFIIFLIKISCKNVK
jgi:hypothetical protein